jgi:hypothetical protein
MPIGEVWDLGVLSAKCKEIGPWEFSLTSAPLHVHGDVAGAANVLALL